MRQKVLADIAQRRRRRGNRSRMRIVATLLTLVIVMVLVLMSLTVPAWAGVPEVQLEVIPTSVELPSQGGVEVLIVARNPTTDVLRDVRLSYFTDAEVDVTVEALASTVLVPYGALAWTLQLSQAGDGPVTGTVHLRVDYIWQGKEEAGAVPCVALGSLEVTAREPEAAEEVADVQAKTALASLMEHRPGIVYVVVKNKSDVPIQVTDILTRGPEGVTFTLSDRVAGVTLAPAEAHAFPVKVEATRTAPLGKHLLLFEIAFKWEKAGRASTGNAIATHEVEVGILGESGILTALGLATVGVPSFLVLPGFLMVMTVGLLWRLFGTEREFPLRDRTKSEFWFVAITLSLLTTLMYPVVTGWLGDSRDFLKGYGLSDVVSVWFASIILAAAAYFLVAGLFNLGTSIAGWYRSREAWQRTPSPKDTPITVLRKLGKQNLGVSLDRVDVKVEGELQRAYLLQPRVEGHEKIWVGPNIVVVWLVGADPKLRQKVEEQLGPQGSPATLARLLEEGRRRDALRVTWKRMARLTGPYEAKRADVQQVLGPNVIVEQE